jgi:hypothetical protein
MGSLYIQIDMKVSLLRKRVDLYSSTFLFLHGCMLYSSSSRTTMLIDGMRGRLLVVPNYLQSLVASCGALASPRVDGGLAFVALLKLAFLELAATLFTVFVIVL